jgi:cob(I)alamin adenosyltransferase
MTEELPELRHFILPGGTRQAGSYLHFARAAYRRCECLLTKWSTNQTEEQQDTVMEIYLNRLSDYLFTLARFITYKERHQDIIYHKNK